MSINWNELFASGREYRVMNELLLTKTLDACGKNAPATALDIGCGTGDMAVKLAKRGYTVTGVDLASVAVEKAELRSKEAGTEANTTFEVVDIERLGGAGIDKAKYDIITCKLVYAFIQDKPKILNWIKEHLTTGGAFVLIAPVLHEGIEYSPRLQNISVNLTELTADLSAVFSNVNDLHTDYFDDYGDERAIIATIAQP